MCNPEGSYMDIFILWLPSHILGICSSWKVMLCHKMIVYFCHRIASECMLVIFSGQCVFVVSLFIDSGSVLFLPIVNNGHRPLTRDTWRVETTRQLQLTAADTGCGYGETDGAWWLLWWLLSSITCVLVHPRYSPVTVTSSLVQCTWVWVWSSSILISAYNEVQIGRAPTKKV